MDQQGTAQSADMNLLTNLIYALCMIASLVVIVRSVKALIRKLHSRSSNEAGKSFQVLTLQVLGATLLMFLPVYLFSYGYEDTVGIFRPVLLSLHNAMRVFIMDGEFEFIKKSIQGMNGFLHVVYSSYAAAVYALAPAVFTFTIFISVFRDLYAELQLRFHRDAPLYVFSSLNEESAAMAMSILPKEDQERNAPRARCMIVFCNVPRDNEQREAKVALIPHVFDKRASILMMSKPVTEVDVSRFEDEIAFFLMDKSEVSNLRDADSLSSSLKERYDGGKEKDNGKRKPRDLKIFVYAVSAASVPLVDAMSRKVSVPAETVDNLKIIIDQACSSGSNTEARENSVEQSVAASIRDGTLPLSGPFSIMRVDVRTQMAMRIIQEFQRTPAYSTAMDRNKKLTVTLLGLGGIGKEILENLLWMCQQYGSKLIVNVFDAAKPPLGRDPDHANNPLYDRLACDWPELMKTNREWQEHRPEHPDTESNYDIRFFFGINCFSNRFRCMFDEDSADRRRLVQSDIVICSLGDDDRNLEAAMMMRQIFTGDMVKTGKAVSEEILYGQPLIYAVVYDNQRSDCVSDQDLITDYQGKPYNIKTMGSMRTQYDYEGIRKLEEREKKAVANHVSWILTSINMREYLSGNDDDRRKTAEEMMSSYIHYEYYRQSSMAQSIHKEMLKDRNLFAEEKECGQEQAGRDGPAETGPDPLRKAQITEHMRWNAYMRVNGYRFGEKKNDMAKIHQCLISWDELPDSEKIKD